jgi:hypothetical protein
MMQKCETQALWEPWNIMRYMDESNRFKSIRI